MDRNNVTSTKRTIGSDRSKRKWFGNGLVKGLLMDSSAELPSEVPRTFGVKGLIYLKRSVTRDALLEREPGTLSR